MPNCSISYPPQGLVMMFSGALSTLTSIHPKIGNEFSLSDVLEADVPDKYFLSKEKTEDFKRVAKTLVSA